VTANVFDENRRQCAEAGMNDFIPKPFVFAELHQTLSNWLRAVYPAALAAPSNAAVLVPPLRSVDRERCGVLLAQLMPLLDAQMFDAVVVFRQLREVVAGTEWAAQLEGIGQLLDALDFAGTSARLTQLVQDAGWPVQQTTRA
jgi:DNA-binding response OmpR family regulator